ncbi:MAG: twin-arginine translocase TatA/TatE family subunit [Anaerolineae bacterium]|nr:twin-arginine translocase TatA/TatE family subunit [Anaerolineae bacterium]
MNFFGIGPMEMVFILILALIIFGPGRLPEIGRAVGKSIRDFRAMTQEVTSQFSLELEEASTASKGSQEEQAPTPQKAAEPPPSAEPPAEAETPEAPASAVPEADKGEGKAAEEPTSAAASETTSEGEPSA